jgi:hypothetical protein
LALGLTCDAYAVSRSALPRQPRHSASSPRMAELEIRGSQGYECIILPHPPYPGERPEMLVGECNLVVRGARPMPRPTLGCFAWTGALQGRRSCVRICCLIRSSLAPLDIMRPPAAEIDHPRPMRPAGARGRRGVLHTDLPGARRHRAIRRYRWPAPGALLPAGSVSCASPNVYPPPLSPAPGAPRTCQSVRALPTVVAALSVALALEPVVMLAYISHISTLCCPPLPVPARALKHHEHRPCPLSDPTFPYALQTEACGLWQCGSKGFQMILTRKFEVRQYHLRTSGTGS